MENGFKERLQQAVASLQADRLPAPHTGLVLGSGLGAWVERLPGQVIPYEDIAGFPHPTVGGHAGVLKVGREVAVCAGRFHLYEGHTPDTVVLPIFLLQRLGVRRIILTNAAGGINPGYKPGALVLIADHINLSGHNPLRGSHLEELGPRFPDASDIYTHQLRKKINASLARPLAQGVYACMPGPSYETPAEIRMLQKLGADMVGMSTVPEALAAAFLGLQVVGISCITNKAAGLGSRPLAHREVLEAGQRAAAAFGELLTVVLAVLGCDTAELT